METPFRSVRCPKSQKELFGRFKESKEERCQRVLAGIPKLKTAAKLFDEQAYREASARARKAG